MLSIRGTYKKGQVRFNNKILTDIDGELPVIVTFLDEDIRVEELDNANRVPTETKENVRKYRFSDLAGKLEWDGDAVKQQRAIRNEW